MNVRYQAYLYRKEEGVTDQFGNPDIAYHGQIHDTAYQDPDDFRHTRSSETMVARHTTTFENPRDALLTTKRGTLNMNLAAAQGDAEQTASAKRAYNRFLAQMFR